MICAVVKEGVVTNVIMAAPTDRSPEEGASLVSVLDPLHVLPVAIGWLWDGETFRPPNGSLYRPPNPGFEGAADDTIAAALDMAAVGAGDTFFDLGCGDGRVLFAAAARGAIAVGVDINPITDEAHEGVTIIKCDYNEADISSANVVYLFIGTAAWYLTDRLCGLLRPGSRIVAVESPLSSKLLPARVSDDGRIRLYVV